MRAQRTSENPAAAGGPNTRFGRPRILYVSYDGAGEPLGRSQVLQYLFRLSDEFDITLISFEKPDSDVEALRAELAQHGINWIPKRYHRRPPVISTLLDVNSGRRAVRAVGDVAIIHVRSYVPALIALLGRSSRKSRFLFDIRGFWADERVEGGLWPQGGLLYRVAKWCERRFFAEADAVVTLTRASVPQIRAWTKGRQLSIEVIPTCVDLRPFADRPRRTLGAHAVWSGSVGTWYRFDLVPLLVTQLGLPLTVVTRQRQAALDMLGHLPAEVISRPPSAVCEELYAGDIGLCLIKSSFSKVASAPTRLAEYLAAGMPVIVTPGVGDLEELVVENHVGVVVRSEATSAIRNTARAALEMARDPAVPERCREVARRNFDVEVGAASYEALYQELIAVSPTASRG